MKFDKSPAWLKDLFRALQPQAGGKERAMFGYPCAFEGGHMFCGVFASDLFVLLDERGRAELLALPGAGPLMPLGRPSKKYLRLPESMLEDEEEVLRWMRRAFAHASSLPGKVKPSPRKRTRARK